MERKRRTDSPYEYIEGLELQTVDTESCWRQETDINKLFRDGAYGRVEYNIIDALYKYPYMNRKTINRYLDKVLKKKQESWHWYYHIILEMLEDYSLYALRYGDNVFYALPCYVRNLWAKKKHYTVSLPDENISSVLEYASLAQWHIALMEGEKLLQNTLYQNRKLARKSVIVPSYIETIKSGYSYRMFSFCLPRGRNDISFFLEQLKYFWNIMEQSRRKNQITLTVLVSSSLNEIRAMNELMKSFPAAKGRRVYYVLDGNTSEFSGLDCIYYYMEEDGEYLLKTIDLK